MHIRDQKLVERCPSLAEGARLESVWAGNRPVGSNPTLSALSLAVLDGEVAVPCTCKPL